MRRRRINHLLSVGLLVLGVLLLSGQTGSAALTRLYPQNVGYLERAFERAMTGFAVLSGLKAGLAVVEGSTGGVSAGVAVELQVGDVVQAAYDYVDVAWRTLLLGSLSLLGIQMGLEVAALVVGPLCGLLLMGMGLRLLVPSGASWREVPCQALTDLCQALFFLVLILAVVLPASIRLASMLSDRITRPALESASDGFARTSKELFPDSEEPQGGLWAQVRNVPERLERIRQVLGEQAQDLGLWTVQLIAGYLFDCLIFPLGSFVVVTGGLRQGWRYARTEQRMTRMIHELRRNSDPSRS